MILSMADGEIAGESRRLYLEDEKEVRGRNDLWFDIASAVDKDADPC